MREPGRDRGDFLAFPYCRLAGSVVLQAIKDLSDVDPLKSLDALCWILDGDAADLLALAGDYSGDLDYFWGGIANAKFKVNTTSVRRV